MCTIFFLDFYAPFLFLLINNIWRILQFQPLIMTIKQGVNLKKNQVNRLSPNNSPQVRPMCFPELWHCSTIRPKKCWKDSPCTRSTNLQATGGNWMWIHSPLGSEDQILLTILSQNISHYQQTFYHFPVHFCITYWNISL